MKNLILKVEEQKIVRMACDFPVFKGFIPKIKLQHMNRKSFL
jgi:hypothetical protein